MDSLEEIIWQDKKQAMYEEEVIYQHQEQPNEEYFECEAEYLNGTWCQ